MGWGWGSSGMPCRVPSAWLVVRGVLLVCLVVEQLGPLDVPLSGHAGPLARVGVGRRVLLPPNAVQVQYYNMKRSGRHVRPAIRLAGQRVKRPRESIAT